MRGISSVEPSAKSTMHSDPRSIVLGSMELELFVGFRPLQSTFFSKLKLFFSHHTVLVLEIFQNTCQPILQPEITDAPKTLQLSTQTSLRKISISIITILIFIIRVT